MAKAIAVEVFTSLPGLDAIEKTARKRAVTLKAVKVGAKIVQQAAKTKAPKRKRSGALRQSIGIKAVKGTKGKTLALAVVGARSKVEKTFKGRKIKPSKYAHLVEKGTKPHSLLKRSKSKIGKVARAVAVAAGAGKRHPGAKPKPFLRPALDQNKDAAGRAMLDALGAEIKRVIAGAPKGKRVK